MKRLEEFGLIKVLVKLEVSFFFLVEKEFLYALSSLPDFSDPLQL